jgi:hypothetical protein
MSKVLIGVSPSESWESPEAQSKIKRAEGILRQFNYEKDGSSSYDEALGERRQRWKINRDDLGDVTSKLKEFLSDKELRVTLDELEAS